MIAESDKEVKEEGRAAVVHLQLHGPAALEGVARADDESEVVSAQLGVCVGRVGVCVASRRQDGAALDARFCTKKMHVRNLKKTCRQAQKKTYEVLACGEQSS